jgi:hypothetical protein
MTSIFRTPLDHIGPWLLPSATPTVQTLTMSSNNNRLAWVFQSETADALTQVGFLLNTITDGGSMPTYRLSLQGVDGSGLPDGTIKGAGNSAFVTFVPTTGNGFAGSTFTWQTLGTAYTPALGEILALVLDVSSGTANSTNKISVDYGLINVAGLAVGLPYVLADGNATWATGDKLPNNGTALYGLQTASDVFGTPIEAITSVTVSATTEVALRFTLPSGLGTSFQLLGALWMAGNAAAGGRLWRLSLYNGGETSPSLLAQVELDSDWQAVVNSAARWSTTLFDDAASTLSFGTQYHLGLALDSGTTLTLLVYQFHAAGDMKALPWGDSAFCVASRTITYPPGSGGNVFASSSTQLKQRPVLLPILSDWTGTAGSSGGGQLLLRGSVVH